MPLREDSMPTLLEFSNKDDLIARLRASEESLAGWFERRYGDVESIVWDSVGSNTFRAFRKPPSPAEVFRSRANLRLNDAEVVTQINNLGAEDEYDLWLKGFSQDLSTYWE